MYHGEGSPCVKINGEKNDMFDCPYITTFIPRIAIIHGSRYHICESDNITHTNGAMRKYPYYHMRCVDTDKIIRFVTYAYNVIFAYDTWV